MLLPLLLLLLGEERGKTLRLVRNLHQFVRPCRRLPYLGSIETRPLCLASLCFALIACTQHIHRHAHIHTNTHADTHILIMRLLLIDLVSFWFVPVIVVGIVV